MIYRLLIDIFHNKARKAVFSILKKLNDMTGELASWHSNYVIRANVYDLLNFFLFWFDNLKRVDP